MKVRLGGTLSFNVIPKQYESVSATSVFEIEEEFDMDPTSPEFEERFNEVKSKIDEKLRLDIKNKAELSLRSYAESKRKLQKILEE